jgi:hypothetical protein
MDDDEVNDELELPLELAGLNAKEKRNLLRFKRSHNQVRHHSLLLSISSIVKFNVSFVG